MKVYLGPLIVRLYEVGLGENDSTPEATFTVIEKQERPDWTDPRTGEFLRWGDTRNPLGDFFIKVDHPEHKGFGLHGTVDQASIGRDSSMGCIRMRSKDIAEVFDYLPRGSRVTVRR
jgi:lipoprotein-anchoring transpeptidase ErfK/SrfK